MFVETMDSRLINLSRMSSVDLYQTDYNELWRVVGLNVDGIVHNLFAGDKEECQLFTLAIIEALEAGQRVARFNELTAWSSGD